MGLDCVGVGKGEGHLVRWYTSSLPTSAFLESCVPIYLVPHPPSPHPTKFILCHILAKRREYLYKKLNILRSYLDLSLITQQNIAVTFNVTFFTALYIINANDLIFWQQKRAGWYKKWQSLHCMDILKG